MEDGFALKQLHIFKYLISIVAGVRRPTLEATYFEDAGQLPLSVDDHEGIHRVFRGFEVLMKTGGSKSQAAWCSLANLTRHQREYTVSDPTPFAPYAVTVRGRLQPNTFSEMAEPVELTRLDPGLFPPPSHTHTHTQSTYRLRAAALLSLTPRLHIPAHTLIHTITHGNSLSVQ